MALIMVNKIRVVGCRFLGEWRGTNSGVTWMKQRKCQKTYEEEPKKVGQ